MNARNIMEDIVAKRLDELLEDYDCCKCEDCKNDMMAIALNLLPAKYVNSLSGQLIAKLNETKRQNSVDVDCAITKAIEIVSSNPNHNK